MHGEKINFPSRERTCNVCTCAAKERLKIRHRLRSRAHADPEINGAVCVHGWRLQI